MKVYLEEGVKKQDIEGNQTLEGRIPKAEIILDDMTDHNRKIVLEDQGHKVTETFLENVHNLDKDMEDMQEVNQDIEIIIQSHQQDKERLKSASRVCVTHARN